MISDHHTECVCNHLTHFAVFMEFTDNADNGKVKIFFYSTKKKVIRIYKRYIVALKLSHLCSFININISFDTDKIIMTSTVFQSG